MDNDLTIDFPKTVFRKKFGIGLDHGASSINIAYTSEVGDKIRVHFHKKPSTCPEKAYRLLAEKCKGKLPAGTQVFTCGLEAKRHQAQLTSITNLKPVVTSEMGRLVQGFRFLVENLAWGDVMESVDPQHVATAASWIQGWKGFMAAMAATGKMQQPKWKALDDYLASGKLRPVPVRVEYPVLLCNLDSGYDAVKLEADGTLTVVHDGTMGGKTLDGLSSILVGTKDFDELVSVSKGGNQGNVDMYTSELNMNPDDELYTSLELAEPQKIFPFGLAVGKTMADLNKSDVAMSLLDVIPDVVFDSVNSVAILHDIKQVFMVGGFPTCNPYIKKMISIYTASNRFYNPTGKEVDYYFVKNADTVSAVGSLLMNIGHNVDAETHL